LGRQPGFVLASLAALAVVVALSACGGGGSSSGPTAAQLYAQEIQVGSFEKAAKGIDPDELDRSGVDTTTSVISHGNDRYTLLVQNLSDVGFINSFWWVAGAGVTISKVTGSSSGTCELSDASTIKCDGMTIKPPTCTCVPGGRATIDFVAKIAAEKNEHGQTQGGFVDSRLKLHEMTPVPYHIPSYKGAGANVDLPLCAKGQVSTKGKLCVHAA
jgi:hypothetical protein